MTEKIETNNFHIPSLDGLRAIAVSLVFLTHAGLGKFLPGGFGVTIFFFLSGYLITTLIRREFERTGDFNFKNFYIRRMLRIWPNFYLVLVIGTVLTLAKLIPGNIEILGQAAQFLHLANYHYVFYQGSGTTIGSAVFWSLAVEEHFYLLFPVMYVGILKYKPKLLGREILNIVIFMCLIFLFWRIYLVAFQQVPAYQTYYLSDTRFDSLLFGCGLAIFKNPMIDVNDQISKNALLYFLLPVGFILLLYSFIDRSQFFRDTFRYSLQGVALVPIFLAAIRFPEFWLFRPLNFRVAKFIGVLSYSIYLINLTIIDLISHFFPSYSTLIQGMISLIVTLLIAYLIHIFVEIKLTRFRKKYI